MLLVGWLLVINLPLLVLNNVFSINDTIVDLLHQGYFSDYVSGQKINSITAYYWAYHFSLYISWFWIFAGIAYCIPYRLVGVKLLFLTLAVFLFKSLVFFLHNNDQLWPWTDKILYVLVGLFVLLRGHRWRYKELVSEERDTRYLQFTIKRPTKFKHLLGAILRMVPAGTYRALIYDDFKKQDYQWHFPDHWYLDRRLYQYSAGDVIKTATDAEGNKILAADAQRYVEDHRTKPYHWFTNNCDNYWRELSLPSQYFRVSLKRKR